MNNNNTTFKDTPLSKIPSDWEVKELIKVASYVDYRGKTPVKTDSGRFLVTAKNIKSGYIDYQNSQEYISEKEYHNVMKRGVPKIGDILITTEAPLGNVAMIDREDIALAQRVIKYRAKTDEVDNYYLLQYLLSDKFQQILDLRSTGSTAKGIKGAILHKLPIDLPPILEQKAIAHILGLMDSAINTNNKLIAKKELQKKWLIQNLMTGKRRLNGFSQEWKEIHIKDVSSEVSIRNKADNQLTVLSCTKYDGLVPSLEYFGRKLFSDDVSTYKVVPKNHFAYATNHIEEGSIGYQDTFKEALISPMYTVFKTDSSINDTFFYKLLKSHKVVYQYQNRMEGSIDRRGGLRWDAFSIIKVQIPSFEEQSAIANVLEIANKEIQVLKTKTEKLREQKKGLMQVLLTGKIRLSYDI
ncbi:MAG: restriction endonuclease subunit S [Bacteroidia bacterium]|nr:restriction endonuclease subunit S [Bacteroidia bacterium]